MTFLLERLTELRRQFASTVARHVDTQEGG